MTSTYIISKLKKIELTYQLGFKMSSKLISVELILENKRRPVASETNELAEWYGAMMKILNQAVR